MRSNLATPLGYFAVLASLGGALLWLQHGNAVAPTVGGSPQALEREQPAPAPLVARVEPPERATGGPAVASAGREVTARIHVVVRLPDGVRTAALPVPELYRLDGNVSAPALVACNAPRDPTPAQLASTSPVLRRGAAAEARRTFEVDRPGRYAVAWHLWLPVPGTRTWRVQRGGGPEVTVSEEELERDVTVPVGAGELELDALLDTRAPAARYHFTEKDGD